MLIFITVITLTHASFFAYGEYALKRKRVLSQNEINSATVDGVLFLAIVALTIFTKFSTSWGYVYISLAILSCISIIKNELFYPVNISPKERIIHAFLYVLHPLILYCFYISWSLNFFVTNMTFWTMQLLYLILGFKTITYHIIYWNYIHDK
jgi:hypothetical protein